MIDLRLPLLLAEGYRRPSQRIRIVTEHWVARHAGCPSCARHIERVPNNRPGVDFVCQPCGLSFELKSKRGSFGARIVDGAYGTMISKINHQTHSNFFLLSYDDEYTVTNLVLIPKRFIVPEIVEKRKPLGPAARRCGWEGCNLRISLLPVSGQISYVRGRLPVPRETVSQEWRKTEFLNDIATPARGWLIAVMDCIEKVNKPEFSLRDLYDYVPHLQSVFPNNHHIEAKIRQQLQVLRDKRWLEFLGAGRYRLAAH